MYTRNLFQNLLIKTKFFHSYINLVTVYILVCYIELNFIVSNKVY